MRRRRIAFAAILIIIIFVGLGALRRARDEGAPQQPSSVQSVEPGVPITSNGPSVNSDSESSGIVEDITRITDEGGRIAWYHGSVHNLIAYDAITGSFLSRDTDVFTMNPDGSGRFCVTCDSDVPEGFIGQPAWHPNGEYLLVQAENQYSDHGLYNHPAWGINQDLWVVKRDGTGARRIWMSEENHGALHSHFNKDGTKIIFSERIPTGQSVPGLARISPGGENPWNGWQIHIADFNSSTMTLSNHRTLKPNGNGMYETHGFIDDGRILYSYTRNGLPYVDDVYTANADGSNVQNLINSPTTWEEHGSFSPTGSGAMVFISSRAYPSWQAPEDRASTLRTELFMRTPGGEVIQLTQMNETLEGKRLLTSDFDWDSTGQYIAFQAAPFDEGSGKTESPQIWLLRFTEPQ